MTIKKLKTVKAAPQPKATDAAADGTVADLPATTTPQKSSAAIASRLQLNSPDPAALKAASASKKATQFALTAALIALVVAGILTFVLYKHWEFLMPA